MYPSTLYELAGLPWDVPAELVRAAALVESVNAGPEAVAALNVLADPGARADYDARASQGLGFELAWAWAVAAYAAGDIASALARLQRALHISPDDRAVPLLLQNLPADGSPRVTTASARADARREIARLNNNSAFPHRLLRYASAMASEAEGDAAEQADVMENAARELLQYDMAEAPRSYAMVLPVLREHYAAVYALDEPFFDATAAVLADHAPAAEYDRGKRRYRQAGPSTPAQPESPPPLDLPELKLPPLRFPERRLDLAVLPRPGYAWVGAVLGALLLVEDGPRAMAFGALVGFLFLWAIIAAFRR